MVRVYALGSNGEGQLGFDHREDLMVPQLTWRGPAGRRVRKIVCGGNHSVMLLEDGTVKCCGNNQVGQLLETPLTVLEPGWHDVDGSWTLDSRIKDIACGWEFTLCVTTNNTVYVRGSGPKGELGSGELNESNTFLKILEFDNSLSVKIFSSFQNCCVLVNDSIKNKSEIWGWGSNLKCQLFEPKQRKITHPTSIFNRKVTDPSHLIADISMGKDFIILVDQLGRIVQTQGNIPKDFSLQEYSHLENLQIKSMWSSMHILDYNKEEINSYGFGIHNQLLKQYSLKSIHKVVMGSEHGILVTQDSDQLVIKCWGWGEHGNCGPSRSARETVGIINDKSNEKSEMNEIMRLPRKEVRSINIFGGCASTWIVVDEM